MLLQGSLVGVGPLAGLALESFHRLVGPEVDNLADVKVNQSKEELGEIDLTKLDSSIA